MEIVSFDVVKLQKAIDDYIMEWYTTNSCLTRKLFKVTTCIVDLTTGLVTPIERPFSKRLMVAIDDEIIETYDEFTSTAIMYIAGLYNKVVKKRLMSTVLSWLPVVAWRALEIRIVDTNIVSPLNPHILRSVVDSQYSIQNLKCSTVYYYYQFTEDIKDIYIYSNICNIDSLRFHIKHNGEIRYAKAASSTKRWKNS